MEGPLFRYGRNGKMLQAIWKAYHMYWMKYHNSCRDYHFKQRDMH
jgi:hypothetical protein